MSIQRFKAALPTGSWPNNPEPLVRDPNGAFVKYEDYDKLRTTLVSALDGMSAEDIHAATGAPLAECEEALCLLRR